MNNRQNLEARIAETRNEIRSELALCNFQACVILSAKLEAYDEVLAELDFSRTDAREPLDPHNKSAAAKVGGSVTLGATDDTAD